jgi:hypothetical protein
MAQVMGAYLSAAGNLAGAVVEELIDKKEQFTQNASTPSPSAWAEGDPLSFNTLSYPSDITNNMENGHYMLFYVNVQNKTKYRYKDPKGVDVGDRYEIETNTYRQTEYEKAAGIGENADNIIKTVYTESTGAEEAGRGGGEISYRKGQITGGAKGNILTSDRISLTQNVASGFSAQYPTTTRITDSVALYLPAAVSDNTSAGYDGMETGILGLVAAGGGAFMDAMKNQDYVAAASTLVGGVQAVAQQALKTVGAEAVSLATAGTVDAEAVSALGAKAFGQAENPYIEMMFKQMSLRDFTYDFTFSPRNQQETEEVQAIIKLFRFHMAPELKGNNHRYLTLPSTFDIHYMYQYDRENAAENNFYSKISTCVLSGVSVNYTPTGVKSFADGAPTQITMNLAFKETQLLTKEKINQGF